MGMEERERRDAMKAQVADREARLLSEATASSAQMASPPTTLVPPPRAAQRGGAAAVPSVPYRQVAACALPMHIGGDASSSSAPSLALSEAHALLGAIGKDVRFVLLGEASHGTKQFYETRAQLTRLLIEKHGFCAVVVEGDWPDAQRTCRYVSGRALKDRTASDALGDFGRRFPAFMWRNKPTEAFIEWLRKHNEVQIDAGSASLPVGFYRMDLYSLHRSAEKVIEYLDGVDQSFAAAAREAYSVFAPYAKDPFAYGKALAQQGGHLRVQGSSRPLSGVEIQRKLEAVLTRLQRNNEKEYEYELKYTAEQKLDAEINAEIVVNAEAYYRECWEQIGSVNTWNVRDQHMVQVLMRLEVELKNSLNPHAPTNPKPKIVVWAHNSHVGDVRATESHSAIGQRANTSDIAAAAIRGASQLAPKWSLGHLCRETFGRSSVFSVGYSMYEGTVTAANNWNGPVQCFTMHPAKPGSVGEVMHHVLPHVREVHQAPQANGFCLLFSDRGLPNEQQQKKGHAAAEDGGIWSRGDPMAAAAAKAAAATEEERLLHTLGSMKLRASRVATLRRALYANRPQRFIGVCYKKEDEDRAHYVSTVLPELYDALIHIEKVDGNVPIDVVGPRAR